MDDRQTQTLVSDFVQYKFKGRVIDAIVISRELKKQYGLTVDWHRTSYALQILDGCDVIQVTGHKVDGMTQYIVD